ncbi:MAG TPA: hypothetical protein VK886_10105 [Vicinamibacterales bacterium]|nr:hypothetical protein [Vicinamibacterales bacterium]
MPARPLLDRRVLASLEATPRRIPVLLGPCGSGRTSALMRLREHFGRATSQYVDVERVATTPERFLASLRADSPFSPPAGLATTTDGTAREAFDALLAFLAGARASGGGPATFFLDEVLELRTFESFPGLRSVLRDLVTGLAPSPNRFVLTSRYLARAQRLLRDAPSQFELIAVPPLSVPEAHAALADMGGAIDEETMRAIHALADGRPAYVRAIASATRAMRSHGPGDPVAALTDLLAPAGALFAWCRFCYELRLHRARGYGALKAILEVLSAEEPLTLTEIAHRLRRTPGSTKDYLSWLEDVDLIESKQKRYRFADPLLRLWVRLHCRPAPIADDDLAREVHSYAMARLPQPGPPPAPEPTPALALAGVPADGIIEID